MEKLVSLSEVPEGGVFYFCDAKLTKLWTGKRIVHVQTEDGSQTTLGIHDRVTLRTPDPTPEEIMTARLTATNRWLASEIEQAKTMLVQFRHRFEESPSYAFEWSEDAVKAAANLEVFQKITIMLESFGLEDILRDATLMALQGARSPKHSTSPVSNLVDEYRTAAWASFASRVR